MSKLKDILQVIANNIVNLNPNLSECNIIARKNALGQIQSGDRYVGIDNDKRGVAYIRYREEQDKYYDKYERQFTSSGNTYQTRSAMRLVVMHKFVEKREEYEDFLISNILGADLKNINEFREAVLISSSTNLESVTPEETDKSIEELTLNDSTCVVQIDFDIYYITELCTQFNHNEC